MKTVTESMLNTNGVTKVIPGLQFPFQRSMFETKMQVFIVSPECIST